MMEGWKVRKEFMMKQEKSGINIFHFKMDSEMKDRLKGLDLFKKAGSLSGSEINQPVSIFLHQHPCKE